MSTQNNSTGTNNSSSQENTPNGTDPRQSTLANNNEIVNEEEQNQVINAQPAEEFTSSYINSPQTTEENTTVNANSYPDNNSGNSNNVSINDLEAGSDEDLNLDQPLE